MKIFGQKIHNNEISLPEIKKLVEYGNKIQQELFDLNDLIKIVELLGGEYKSKLRKGGSSEKFYHPVLEKVPTFQAGIFSVHIAHGKKNMVYKRNYQNHFYPVLITIIDLIEKQK
jgi:hypothetical protein